MNEFYALMNRMKFIERWGLMRSTKSENVAEHSNFTAMLAHSLALMENKLSDEKVDAERVALMGLYHEAAEVLTGDLPTPVKYYSPQITKAYKEIERRAEERICSALPPLVKDELTDYVIQKREGKEGRLIKAADKLAALIKCAEETKAGNSEFSKAFSATLAELKKSGLKSVEYFLKEILPSFELNLDEYFS